MTHRERFYATIERRPVDRPASWLGLPAPAAHSGLFSYFGVNSVDALRTRLDDDMGDNVQVAATGLADGDFVFASATVAGTTADRGYIYKWELGDDDEWDSMTSDDELGTAGDNVTGLLYFNGILYAVNTDNGTDSQSFRTTNPTSSTSYWRNRASADETFAATPSALRASSDGESTTKLWALDTTGSQLMSYADTLVTAVPTLKGPADGHLIEINAITGQGHTIPFTWLSPTDYANEFDFLIATDADFDEPVVDSEAVESSGNGWDEGDTVSQMAGPSGAAPFLVDWMPGQTYYWKVRVDSDNADDRNTRSGYSEVRTFTIANEPQPQAPVIIQPAPPAPQITLPQPKVEITVPPPTEVKIPPAPPPPAAPAPITPAYIWATIIIGAVLIIALIILIVRTRRVS